MKIRIFIVEDQAIVAEDLSQILMKNGYEVVGIATSGNEAIDEIKKISPDLILMDVRIRGEINGIEVAIIVQGFLQKPVPIIFLTGFEESTFGYLKVLDEYLYINKPVVGAILLEAIERALKKNQTSPELSNNPLFS
jgi:two-component SAPR family response regulator